MAANDSEFEEGAIPDAESTNVLPNPAKGLALSWEQVRAHVPQAKERAKVVDRDAVQYLLETRDKELFEEKATELWPFRTKTDRSLRRTRLLDYVVHLRSCGRLADLTEVLTTTKDGWDQIFVTNLLAATSVFGIFWFRRWAWLGAYAGDLSHYIAVAKKVHDIGKSVGILEKQWTWFVECATLGGYRNPPFPGFDVVKETEALAHGGDEHRYYGYSWTSLCDELLPMGLHPAKYTPFREWVQKAEWLTGGASSVGKVEIEYEAKDGKTKHKFVKARKNMVADVCELAELADEAMQTHTQVNYTIIKSELGKLRLAVAGDLYTYLKMTWVNELLGGAYYDWPGNTSEENFEEQTRRLAKMLELCSRCFGLPYDYAGFDHQPTTEELVGIVERLITHARLNVPDRRAHV